MANEFVTTRVPVMQFKFDNSNSKGAIDSWKTLIIGHSLSNASAVIDTPYLINSEEQADVLFGAGSLTAEQVRSYKLNDKNIELWAMSIAENNDSTAASCSIIPTIELDQDGKTPKIITGIVTLYIGGKRVSSYISPTNQIKDISSAIASKINSNPYYSCTASVDTNGYLNLKMNNKGTFGNGIKVFFNLMNETFPAGLSFNNAAFYGGSGTPNILSVFNAIGDARFKAFVFPFSDDLNMKLMSDELLKRWEPLVQNDGYAYTYCNKSISDTISYANNLNSHCISVTNTNELPTSGYIVNAAIAAQCSASAAVDPAMPLKDLPLIGVIPPPKFSQYKFNERSTLLNYGISTYKCVGDSVYIERMVTTYKKNSAGISDSSLLKPEKILTASRARDELKTRLNSKYSRYKLAPDGQTIPVGQKILTPKKANAELISIYKDLEEQGLVTNFDDFKKNVFTFIDKNNGDQLNMNIPIYIMNQLFNINATIQFME